VKLDDYNHTCQGPAILSAYQAFISKFDAVFDDPFGNGDTPAQELGQIYQQILHGQYPQSSLPPGCTLNTSASVPQSLPAACQSLVDSTTGNGPLAYATSQLGQVTTQQGISESVQLVQDAINAGSPSGTLTEKGYAVIRQLATRGTVSNYQPTPNDPNEWADYLKASVPFSTNGKLTAEVWSCAANTLQVKDADGTPTTLDLPGTGLQWIAPGMSWSTLGVTLQKTGTWQVASFLPTIVDNPASKGDPCGAGF
jgi:hypothetical protein